MIYTTDLRLGNIVGYDYIADPRLQSLIKYHKPLPSGKYGVVTAIESKGVLLDCINLPGTGLYKESRLLPIAITDEWFIAFGLVKIVKRGQLIYGSMRDSNMYFVEKYGLWYSCFVEKEGVQQKTNRGAKTIHDLQNIYYFETHQELKLNGSTLLRDLEAFYGG